MKPNQKLSSAIVAILGGYAAAGHAQQQAATSPAAAPSDSIAEIVVTAQRKSENIQDVPITIQALTSESLKQLNVTTFDDVAKYLPNVALSSNGPAQGNIFMRGLALGSAGTQSSGTIGLYPNVAVYLDEQSGQLPGRNLDVYAADLERVEILEGPQGTLFGGGAEAGVVRYITNKPKLNKFEGSAEGMYGTTAHGDPNSGFNAVLNIPLIQDTLALRAVFYNEARGGYINNVPSTFTRRDTDLGIYYANYATGCSVGTPTGGVCPGGSTITSRGVPPGSPVINNYLLARDAINPVTYKGGRISALWQMNDDWSALLTQSYQNMEADGVFYQMPLSSEGAALQPLEVTLFEPSYDRDRFSNTALTVNGKLGPLKAVYAGGYLVRNVDQVQDYTNYARGVYADYYQCYGPGGGKFSAAGGYAIYGAGDPNLKSTCFSPASTWREQERNTHQTHELRVSTPDELPLRALVGGFWEDLRIYDQTDWSYKSMPNCPANVVPGGGFGCEGDLGIPAGVTANNPNQRNDSVAFFEDTTKGYRQLAFFASGDWDIVPKVLTLTLGARHYDFHLDQHGWVGTSFGCFEAPAPCYGYGHNMDAEHLNVEYKGWSKRANLTWHITPDAMVYATWSQGYRPGGFNRTSGTALVGTDGKAQYIKPLTFSPDTLNNVEVGFKTEFFNHRLLLDGSLYKEDWKNVQTALFNPGVLGNLTLAVNGADYQVKGAELQLTAKATDQLSVIGAFSYNDAKQVDSPFLIDNNPASATYGQQITEYVFRGQVKQIVDTFGTPGTPTAYSPKWQANLRVRDDFRFDDYGAFWQVGVVYVGDMYNNTNTDPSVNGDSSAINNINTTLFRFHQNSYTTFDAQLGITKDNWGATLFGQNITNQNASTFTSTAQFVKTEVPLRPRVMGVRVSFKF